VYWVEFDKDAQDGSKTGNDMIKEANRRHLLSIKMEIKANVLHIAMRSMHC
jgi:hypothetical protein